MPTLYTVAISFTNDSLVITNAIIYNGHSISRGYPDRTRGLGFSRVNNYPNFWDRIGGAIKASSGFGGAPIDELVLYGEAAEEDKFLDQVRKALGDLENEGRLQIPASYLYEEATRQTKFDSTYISARGAAEFARRWQGVSGKRVLSDKSEAVAAELQVQLSKHETLLTYSSPETDRNWRISEEEIANLGIDSQMAQDLREWLRSDYLPETVQGFVDKFYPHGGMEDMPADHFWTTKLVRIHGKAPEILMALDGRVTDRFPLDLSGYEIPEGFSSPEETKEGPTTAEDKWNDFSHSESDQVYYNLLPDDISTLLW